MLERRISTTLNHPGRALGIATNITTAAARNNPKHNDATDACILKFVHHGKGLYLRKKSLTCKERLKEKLENQDVHYDMDEDFEPDTENQNQK